MTAEPATPAPSSPEFPRLLLALVTIGLLGALAWYLNPPQPDLTPAGLDPQVELPTSPPKAPEEILPTSFTQLPDVDLSPLTVSQKREVLLRLNTEPCPCGCGNTLASCRVTDSACETSRELVPRVVAEVKATPAPE